MSANQALEMARDFVPKQPTSPFKLLLERELAIDLNIIAKIRTAVNKANGATTQVSVTEMLMEAAEDLRASQFADWKRECGAKFGRDWDGKPVTDEQVDAIVEHETALAKELLPKAPPLSILAEPPEPKKKSNR